MVSTFWGKKSLKALSNKVFRFIQQTQIRLYFMFMKKAIVDWQKLRHTQPVALKQAEIVIIFPKFPD